MQLKFKILLIVVLFSTLPSMPNNSTALPHYNIETQSALAQERVAKSYYKLLADKVIDESANTLMLPIGFEKKFKEIEINLIPLVAFLQKQENILAWNFINELGSAYYPYLHEIILELNTSAEERFALLDTAEKLYNAETSTKIGITNPFKPMLIKTALIIRTIKNSNIDETSKQSCIAIALGGIKQELAETSKKINNPNIDEQKITIFSNLLLTNIIKEKLETRSDEKKFFIKATITTICTLICLAGIAGVSYFLIDQAISKYKEAVDHTDLKIKNVVSDIHTKSKDTIDHGLEALVKKGCTTTLLGTKTTLLGVKTEEPVLPAPSALVDAMPVASEEPMPDALPSVPAQTHGASQPDTAPTKQATGVLGWFRFGGSKIS